MDIEFEKQSAKQTKHPLDSATTLHFSIKVPSGMANYQLTLLP